VKGINSRGNVQKGFIVPKDLWDAVSRDVRTKGFAVSDVLRSGLQLYLDGKIKERDIEVWRDREQPEPTPARPPAKKTAAAAKAASPATVAARTSRRKSDPAPAPAETGNAQSVDEEAEPAA
jgi:hypothetical protein